MAHVVEEEGASDMPQAIVWAWWSESDSLEPTQRWKERADSTEVLFEVQCSQACAHTHHAGARVHALARAHFFLKKRGGWKMFWGIRAHTALTTVAEILKGKETGKRELLEEIVQKFFQLDI